MVTEDEFEPETMELDFDVDISAGKALDMREIENRMDVDVTEKINSYLSRVLQPEIENEIHGLHQQMREREEAQKQRREQQLRQQASAAPRGPPSSLEGEEASKATHEPETPSDASEENDE